MERKKFRAKCPCCGEWLTVDVHLRRLEGKFEELGTLPGADSVQEEQKRAEDSFFDALDEEQRKDKPGFEDYL